MSKLPTLLIPGNINPSLKKDDPYYKKTQETLNKYQPIEYIMQWIKKRYPGIGQSEAYKPTLKDRILIIKSEVGSGKSTIITPYIYKNFIYNTANERQKPAICITLPRVVNAKELAIQISKDSYYVPLELGRNIGYKTGSLIHDNFYGIKFMTIGILYIYLKTLTDDMMLNKFQFIIIDECHNRSIETDSTLYLLREFMNRNIGNPRLPFVLLMSGTVNTEIYAKYFNIYEEPKLLEPDIHGIQNIILISGYSHPIEVNWALKSSTNVYLDTSILINKIHKENQNDKPECQDILVFVSSMNHADEIIKYLKKTQNNFIIIKLDSPAVEKQSKDYNLLMAPPSDQRRIILSSVVAEVGITFPTLKYIIDLGWYKSTYYFPETQISALIETYAAQSRVLQRKGRVGRLNPGVFYAMYTQETFNQLPEDQIPSILESDFCELYLSIAALYKEVGLNIKTDICEKLMDAPSGQQLCIATSKLMMMGFIKPSLKNDIEITDLGLIASKFYRLRPESIRMILNGYVKYPPMPTSIINNKITYEQPIAKVIDLITIAAIIESRDNILKKMTEEVLTDLIGNIQDVWNKTKDELIIGLYVFNAIAEKIKNGEEINEKINMQNFVSVIDKRREIIDTMISIGLDVNYSIGESNIIGLKRSIFAGYVANTLQGDTTTAKYNFKYINSCMDGIDKFKMILYPSTNNAAYNQFNKVFPENIIAITITLQETFSKKEGFNEWRAISQWISVLDDFIPL